MRVTRFEIACYKNKVIDWRNGKESNLDQVLQTDEIYSNAVQGEICKDSIFEQEFPGMKKEEIIKLVYFFHPDSGQGGNADRGEGKAGHVGSHEERNRRDCGLQVCAPRY